MTVQITDITEGPVYLLGWDANRTVYPTGISSSEAVGTAQANASVTASGVAPAGAVGTVTTVASVAATGIDAASGAVGDPALTAIANPPGIGSGVGTGQVQLNTTAPVFGIPSTSSLGNTTAFISMNVTGIASTAAVGDPSVNLVMSPTGIAGSEQVGDADTLATVFIIPGPVDPSNDFGTVNITRKGFLFRGPRTTYQWRIPPYKEYEGISLLREDGVWSEVQHPDLPRTLAAQIYLAGGRDHFVTETTRDELVALGYTVTEEIIP